MANYRLLEWDSGFFGFPVATILSTHMESEELAALLDRMRLGGIRLAYWATNAAEGVDPGVVSRYGGTLVDEKTTYVIDRSGLATYRPAAELNVEPHRSGEDEEQLRALGTEAGRWSRFFLDPQIPREKSEELYTRWIDACMEGSLADTILVIRQDGEVAGMVTLEQTDRQGRVGLFAVAPAARGRGLGTTLMQAANEWFWQQDCLQVRVVTQRANVAACRLYVRAGYGVESVRPFYHFWL